MNDQQYCIIPYATYSTSTVGWPESILPKCPDQPEKNNTLDKKNKFNAALIYEVHDLISSVKDHIFSEYNITICDRCNNELKEEDCLVRHKHGLPSLAAHWLWINNLTISKVDITEDGCCTYMTDSDLRSNWKKFYQEKAIIRPMCVSCSLG